MSLSDSLIFCRGVRHDCLLFAVPQWYVFGCIFLNKYLRYLYRGLFIQHYFFRQKKYNTVEYSGDGVGLLVCMYSCSFMHFFFYDLWPILCSYWMNAFHMITQTGLMCRFYVDRIIATTVSHLIIFSFISFVLYCNGSYFSGCYLIWLDFR